MKRLSEDSYDRVVTKFAGKNFLKRAEDERRLFAATVSGPGAEIAGFALSRALLSASLYGVKANEASACLTFPEGTEESFMREFVKELAAASVRHDVKISGIDVRLNDSSEPAVTVTAGGEASARRDKIKSLKKDIKSNAENYHILLCGNIAIEKTVSLRREMAEELEKLYPLHFLDEKELEEQLYVTEGGSGAASAFLEIGEAAGYALPIGDGGVFEALRQLGLSLNCGLCAHLPDIFVSPLTVEICETTDISPYEVPGGGACVAVTDEPEKVLAVCKVNGVSARIIGNLSEGTARAVINGDEKRFLDKRK